MESGFFVMVLAAAVLHAVWNAVIKIQGDRLSVMATVTGTSGLCCLPFLFFLPFPDVESRPYIGASLVLHNAYYLFLITGYRYGDLGHIYPLARGVVPLLVTVISVFFLGERLTANGLVAIGLISLGLGILTTTRGVNRWKSAAAALATGACVALYTVIDSLGLRASGNPHSYTFWLFFLDGFPLLILVAARKRRETLNILRSSWPAGLSAGVISLIAIWMVMWALAFTPAPYVSALRETSVIFAVLIGVFFLKERLNLRRAAAVSCALAGAVLLRLAG